MAMHDDEVPIEKSVVRRLIAEQFPEWRTEPITRLATAGTVNAIFRIGSGLTARFPLRRGEPEAVRGELVREADAMRELAAACPFPTPRPVAMGAPGLGHPLPWTVQTWLPGTIATPDGLAGSDALARDVVELIRSLRRAGTRGRTFSGGGRGGDLRDGDEWMETCLARSSGLLPVERARRLWNRFRELPDARSKVMTHGDLIPGNLLVDGDRLVGVLDGGGFGPADRSLDLVAAWHLFDSDRRALIRGGLACDELEWRRGAAWAFQQAMGLVWYYRESNPVMSALGRSTLTRILSDPVSEP